MQLCQALEKGRLMRRCLYPLLFVIIYKYIFYLFLKYIYIHCILFKLLTYINARHTLMEHVVLFLASP